MLRKKFASLFVDNGPPPKTMFVVIMLIVGTLLAVLSLLFVFDYFAPSLVSNSKELTYAMILVPIPCFVALVVRSVVWLVQSFTNTVREEQNG